MIDWHAEQSDKFIGTAAAILTAAAAATTAGASVYSAKKQAGAANHGADLQAQAARYAADQQTAASQKAEEYARQQAEASWRNDELTRHANRDIYATRIQGAKSLGDMIGFKLPDIPDYVPSEDPRYTTNGTQGPPTTGTSTGGADPKIAAFIQDYQAKHPVSEGIAPLADALKAAGFNNVSRYMYGQTPSNNELNIGGQKFKVLGAENSPNAYWYKPGMNDSGPTARVAYPSTLGASPLSMLQPPPIAPTPDPYRPGTLGAYAMRSY